MRYEPESIAERAARMNRDMLHKTDIRPDSNRAAAASAGAVPLRKLPTAGAMRKAPTADTPPAMSTRPTVPGTTGAGSLAPPAEPIAEAAGIIRATVEAAARTLASLINRPADTVAADLLRLTGEAMRAGKAPEAALETAKSDLIGRVMAGSY